jgi:hypothetical protein
MKKKNKFIVLFGAVAALTVGLAGCGELTKLQSYQEQGYVVSVTYDANGGIFEYDKKISIMDLYNPSNYEADAEGTVQIKLTAPENPVRTQPGKEDLTLTYSDHFLTGWYQKRELKLVNGYPVDEQGNLLFEYNAEEEIYYYVLTGENGLPVEGVRARTEKDEKSVEKYRSLEKFFQVKINCFGLCPGNEKSSLFEDPAVPEKFRSFSLKRCRIFHLVRIKRSKDTEFCICCNINRIGIAETVKFQNI